MSVESPLYNVTFKVRNQQALTRPVRVFSSQLEMFKTHMIKTLYIRFLGAVLNNILILHTAFNM